MVDVLCKLEEDDIKFQEEFLEKLSKIEEKVIANFDIIYQEGVYIARIYLGASDWPGLGETVIGIVHEKGYNIAFVYGVVSTDGKYAFIAIKIPFPPEKLNDVRFHLEEITEELKRLAREGDQIKARLVTTGIEKLEILEKIKSALRDIAFPEEYEEISKTGGELEKFVFSRSLAYLKERDPKTLAEIILVGHRFIKKLRQVGMGVEIYIKNIQTEREELTGLTIGGFQKDISMDEVFDLIKEVFPNFQRKFDKEFITDDGICIIRVEFTVNNRPLTPEEQKKLEQHLKTNLKQGKIRVPLNIKFGGEIFGRALVPKMVDEALTSHIPQVAIIPIEQSKTTVTFRIAIVDNNPEKFDTLIKNIAKSDGFVLISFRPPSKVREEYVLFLTVRGLVSFFNSDVELFEKLKDLIRESIGPFRDFDEGLRTIDRKKLEKIYHLISRANIPEELVRTFYFSIDDFIRTTLSPEKIAEDINFVSKCIQEHLENENKKLFVRYEKNSLTIVIVYQPEERIFDKIFPIVEKYEPILVRFEIYGLNVTFMELDIRNFKEENEAEIIENIKKEVYNENYHIGN
jgi:regulator of replication initiation timing